jgi:subtilisin family serine protease
MFLMLISLVFSSEIKVAVIDTGVMPSKYYNLCKESTTIPVIRDLPKDITIPEHGTEVTRYIINSVNPLYSSKFCILSIRVDLVGFSPIAIAQAVNYAIKKNAKIINISLAGIGRPSALEREAIKNALDKGIKVVIAAGNNNIYLSDGFCQIYPACYDKRAYVVGCITRDDIRCFNSNFGPRITHVEIGSGVDKTNGVGTSFAAGTLTGKIINELIEQN